MSQKTFEYRVTNLTEAKPLLAIALDMLHRQAIGQRGLHPSFMTMGPSGSQTIRFTHSDRLVAANRAQFRQQIFSQKAVAYWLAYQSKDQISVYVETLRDHAMTTLKIITDADNKIISLVQCIGSKMPYADLLRNVLIARQKA